MAEFRRLPGHHQNTRSESVTTARRQPRSRSIGASTARIRPTLPSQELPVSQDSHQDPNSNSAYGDKLSDKLSNFNRAKSVGESICICKAARYMERQRIHLQNEEVKLQEQKLRIRNIDEEFVSRQSVLATAEAELRLQQSEFYEREARINDRESQTRTQKQKLIIEQQEFEHLAAELRPKLVSLERREMDISLQEESVSRREGSLLENEKDVAARENDIKSDKEKLENRMERLIGKEREIDNIHTSLQLKEKDVGDRERSLRSQEVVIEQQKRCVSDQEKANKSDRATIERLVELNQTMKREVLQKEQELERKEAELAHKERQLELDAENTAHEQDRLKKLADHLDNKKQAVEDTNHLVQKNEDLLDRCHEMELELDMRRAAIDAQEQAFANKRMICESDWDEMEKNIKALQSKLRDRERQIKEKESEIGRQQELLQKAQNEFNRLLPDHTLKLSSSINLGGSLNSNASAKPSGACKQPKARAQTPTGENRNSAVNKYLQHMQYNAPGGGLLSDKRAPSPLVRKANGAAGLIAAIAGDSQGRMSFPEKNINTKSTPRNNFSENRPKSVSLRGVGSRTRTVSCPSSPEKMYSEITKDSPTEQSNLSSQMLSAFDLTPEATPSNSDPVRNLALLNKENENNKTQAYRAGSKTSSNEVDNLGWLDKATVGGVTPPSVHKTNRLESTGTLKHSYDGVNLISDALPQKTPLPSKTPAKPAKTPLPTKTPSRTPMTQNDDMLTTNYKNRRLSVASPFDWQLSPSPQVNRTPLDENIPPNTPITPATNIRKGCTPNRSDICATGQSLTLSPDEDLDDSRKVKAGGNSFMTKRTFGMDMGVQPNKPILRGETRKGLIFDADEDPKRSKQALLSPETQGYDLSRTPAQKTDESSLYAESPLFNGDERSIDWHSAPTSI
eukprot:Platyproteum_vivax@DN5534_c0_g1_i1.p1